MKALEAVLLLVAVLALLMFVVFPWVEPWLPRDHDRGSVALIFGRPEFTGVQGRSGSG